MRQLIITYSIILLGVCCVPIRAQADAVVRDNDCPIDTVNRLADNFVTASLLIAEPCGVLYSVMGHAALRLQCPTFGLDYVFTYESEAAEQKFLTYVAGKLKMGLFPVPAQDYLNDYILVNRGVKEYILNLPPDIKQELWRVCDQHVEEGVLLPYDYEKRGCAIACVHLLNEALHGETIEYAEWSEKYKNHSRRELAAMAIEQYPWNKFVINTFIGAEFDKECPMEEKLIIPADLAEVWSKASFRGSPLITEVHELSPFSGEVPAKGFTPTMLGIMLVILAIANYFIPKPYIDMAFLGVQTLAGLVFTYLIFFSKLPCSEWYWEFIAYNPLPAIFWRWRRYWSIPYAILLLVWIVAMVAYPHMLVETIYMLFAIAFCMILFKNSKIYEAYYQ